MAVQLTVGDGALELRRIERWLKVIAICFMVIFRRWGETE
jgi:hypothetical protein